MILSPQAGVVTVAAFGLFAFHTLGLAILVQGADALPRWLRALLLPFAVPRGWLRVLALGWGGLMIIVSQLIMLLSIVGRGQTSGSGDQFLFIAELIAAAVWVVWLTRLFSIRVYRR